MKSAGTIVRVGVWLLVVLLPWQARHFLHQPQLNGHLWEYGTIAIYAWDVLLFLVVAFAWLTKQFSLPRRWPMLTWAVGGLFLLSLFSILVADERTPALFGVWLLFKVMLFFMVIVAARPSGSSLMMAFLFSMGIQGLIAVSQVLIGHIDANTWLGMAEQIPGNSGVSVIETGSGRFLRGYGMFPHPNMLGGSLAIAIILGAGWLAMASQQLQRWQRLFCLVALALCSAGLVASFSRAAWLATSIGLLCILGALILRRTVLWPMVFICLIIGASAGLTLGFVPGSLSNRLSDDNRLTSFSQEQRTDVWQDTPLGRRRRPAEFHVGGGTAP